MTYTKADVVSCLAFFIPLTTYSNYILLPPKKGLEWYFSLLFPASIQIQTNFKEQNIKSFVSSALYLKYKLSICLNHVKMSYYC